MGCRAAVDLLDAIECDKGAGIVVGSHLAVHPEHRQAFRDIEGKSPCRMHEAAFEDAPLVRAPAVGNAVDHPQTGIPVEDARVRLGPGLACGKDNTVGRPGMGGKPACQE